MWAIIGSRWDHKRIRNERLRGKYHFNEDGECTLDGRVLVQRRYTHCPNAPGDDFFHDGKWAWVPATECRKCLYHRPSQRHGPFRFPRCAYGKADNVKDAARDTLMQVSGIVSDAVRQTKEIMGES